MSKMNQERANRVRKVFAVFNLLFLIGGIVFIALGATVLITYQNYSQVLSGKFYSLPTFMIISGAVAFIIGFLGCCGAFQKNFCMVISFILLLISLFIFEISIGISGYVLRDDISYILTSEMRKSITMYVQNSIPAKRFWDYIQVEYNCCGATHYNDWLSVINGNNNLPISCCDTTGLIGSAHCSITDTDILRPEGCIYSFGEDLKGHAGTIGGVGIVIALIQLVGVGFAIFVARNIRRIRM